MSDRQTRPDGRKRRSVPRRLLMACLRIVVLSYIGLCLVLTLFQSKLVFRPQRDVPQTPAAIRLDFDAVSLTTSDGETLAAWFVPARAPRGVALFCHGNAGNMSNRLETIDLLRALDLDVLIFDYRGYGESTGKPSEAGTHRDAIAAWRYLTDERGCRPEEIVVIGRSLGGSVAARLAAEKPPAALIVESTFTSIPALASDFYPYLPVRWLCRFSFDTEAALGKVACPVLVVHSREDDLIDFRHGEALYAAARDPKQFLEIRGPHNGGFIESGRTYTKAVEAFLDEYLPRLGG